mgnify:CR=1 FL=1
MRPATVSLTVSILWAVQFGAVSAQETLYSPPSTTPYAQVQAQARLVGELAANHRRGHEVRRAHEKGFLDTLYQVQRAAIPVPDDGSIRYPSAEKWRRVTARRPDESRSSTLSHGEASEKRIEQALGSPTEFDFVEVPLAEAVEYLKGLHGVEIQIDELALAEAGIGTDTPITRELKGISLRSALRLILRDFDLTFVIQDEVILITSQENGRNHRETRVYSLGDLTLPRLRPVSLPYLAVPYLAHPYPVHGPGPSDSGRSR